MKKVLSTKQYLLFNQQFRNNTSVYIVSIFGKTNTHNSIYMEYDENNIIKIIDLKKKKASFVSGIKRSRAVLIIVYKRKRLKIV